MFVMQNSFSILALVKNWRAAANQIATPTELMALEKVLRDAYRVAHPDVRAIIDNDALIKNGKIILSGLERQIKRCQEELPRYPHLLDAVMKVPEIACAVLFAQAVFSEAKRRFSLRRLIYHTFRGAENAAHDFGHEGNFGPDATMTVIMSILHDTVEDGDFKRGILAPIIKRAFGPTIALGVKILTTFRDKSKIWWEDVFIKRQAKDHQ